MLLFDLLLDIWSVIYINITPIMPIKIAMPHRSIACLDDIMARSDEPAVPRIMGKGKHKNVIPINLINFFNLIHLFSVFHQG